RQARGGGEPRGLPRIGRGVVLHRRGVRRRRRHARRPELQRHLSRRRRGVAVGIAATPRQSRRTAGSCFETRTRSILAELPSSEDPMTQYASGNGHAIPDVLDPELYLGDPHPAYAWFRRNAPLFWDERHNLWVVSTYDDCVYISKHPELFCSGKGVRPKMQ